MKLIEGFDSNYRYILVAARRARQLQSGAPPVVDTSSRKPCRIAQDEIRAGKVKWEIPETRSAAEQASESLDKALGQDSLFPVCDWNRNQRLTHHFIYEDRTGGYRRHCSLQGG